MISTDTQGIAFTITKNENSILVESENPASFASAIKDLLKNKQKYTDYGLTGHRLVHEFYTSKIMWKIL